MKSKTANSQEKKSKGEQTRELILSTAIDSFITIGYDATTMRLIAEKCGISLGNAYYYFPSKEHLVLALYEHTLRLQKENCQAVLVAHKTMKQRLSSTLNTQLETLTPFRPVLRSLFRFAGDPDSPLNPFGSESAPIRNGAENIFRDVIDESKEKTSAEMAAVLPFCLWLYQMGILFFWLHDKSEGQEKTTKLVGKTTGLIVDFVLLLSLPLLKPFRTEFLKVVQELKLNLLPG